MGNTRVEWEQHVYLKRLALSAAVPFSLLQTESSRSLLREIRQLCESALIKLFLMRYIQRLLYQKWKPIYPGLPGDEHMARDVCRKLDTPVSHSDIQSYAGVTIIDQLVRPTHRRSVLITQWVR